MKVSQINISRVKDSNGLIGFANFILDDKLFVGNVGIFTRLDGQGIRLSFPKTRELHSVHPITKDLGQKITEAVQQRYYDLFFHPA